MLQDLRSLQVTLNPRGRGKASLSDIEVFNIQLNRSVCVQFPDPVIKIAIEPKSKADLEKMSNGLIKLAQEDPSFHFSRDEETNQTVIEGMGELHLVSSLSYNISRNLISVT